MTEKQFNRLKWSDETTELYLTNRGYEVWPNMWIRVVTTSRELANSLGKEVLKVYYKWR